MARLSSNLNIHEFGETLINTRDLDPLYVGLVGAGLPKSQLYRYLLAYLCFYHVGSAAWLSEHESTQYWRMMMIAAENDPSLAPSIHGLSGARWPRARERRHFRGEKCVDTIKYLAANFPKPEDAVTWLAPNRTATAIMQALRRWPMFGSWASFKAADIFERCCPELHVPLITPDLVLIYDEPYQALEVLAQDGTSPQDYWSALLRHFSQFRAPPQNDRPCGPAECESILCKHKAYLNGHYRVGQDIKEQRHALNGWGETAKDIRAHYPMEVAV